MSKANQQRGDWETGKGNLIVQPTFLTETVDQPQKAIWSVSVRHKSYRHVENIDTIFYLVMGAEIRRNSQLHTAQDVVTQPQVVMQPAACLLLSGCHRGSRYALRSIQEV